MVNAEVKKGVDPKGVVFGKRKYGIPVGPSGCVGWKGLLAGLVRKFA